MKIKKSHLNIGLLLFILLFTITGMIYQGGTPQYKIETPKTSDGEISIITPENKTYTESMHGYYPATYGFENELDGTSRTSIDYVDGTNLIQSNCDVEIVNNFQGHNKVLRIHDGNTNGNAEATHYFDSSQTTGTIEWWWLSPTISNHRMWIHFHQDQIGTRAFRLRTIDGEFLRNDGTAVQSYNSNQWYHHKVSFDTISDTYDWYIDGLMVVNGGTFENTVLNVGSTNLKGAWTTIGESYFDAFGYSWNSDYSVGDNRDEGLLLNYENSTPLDWQGYSLDGNSNKTILGSTTIPMPSDGRHRIQVFGNDSIGMMHESNVQYFSVDTTSFLNIITPENTGYFEPMSGYYLGTTGFEDTDNGLLPPNMDDIPSGSNCQATVASEKTDHNKVVHIDDDSSITKVRLNYNFTNLDYGFLEFWVLAEDATFGLVMQFWDDDTDTDLFSFNINYDKWHYYIDSNWYVIPAFDGSYNPQDNTWYHVEVHFRGNNAPAYKGLNENQYKLIIDGRDSGRINFDNKGASIERLRFFTGDASTFDFWVDAFGVSSDLDYILNDNLYKGLLLSFDHSDNFDWIGYSLDGNPIITITGNKVIKTEVGTHSIILNGINFEGMMIQSNLRYFITYYENNPPPIVPDNPYLIPIFLTSIAFGIITSLGITLFLLIKKRSPRTSSIINSPVERSSTPKIEYINLSSEQIRFCPNCGATADNTYKFCANCGASFKDI